MPSAVTRRATSPTATSTGFAGTTPFGEIITDEFIARLCEVDPNLTDLNYASETYDAVMITALAVDAGRRRRHRPRLGDQRRHPRR